MCGHGRGHAGRAHAVVEILRSHHEIFLFCPGDAYDFLAPIYQGTSVRVMHLPLCLRFVYRRQRVSLPRSLWHGLGQARRLRSTVAWMEEQIERHAPHLAIVDAEPALPRAAKRANLPFLAIDNQHQFVTDELPRISRSASVHCFLANLYVRAIYGRIGTVILPTFDKATTKARYRDRVHHVGPLLRPSVLSATTADEGFILAYLRESLPRTVLEVLEDSPHPVRVYGLGRQPARGSLTFRELDADGFASDLARCRAVVSTAGHQLASEAVYLKKPMFLLPETGHVEQEMNARQAAQVNVAFWCPPPEFSRESLLRFLSSLDRLRSKGIQPGNQRTRSLVEAHMRKGWQDEAVSGVAQCEPA